MHNTYATGPVRKSQTMRLIWLGLGSNLAGPWGSPGATLQRAVAELERSGLAVRAQSRILLSKPLGARRQPIFHNMIIGLKPSIPAAALLRRLKHLEREAGRRLGRRWGPRQLDLDILSAPGTRVGHRSSATTRGTLVLPHPEMTHRAFVLVPLSEIAPGWRHPVLGASACDLLRRQPHLRRGLVTSSNSGS